MSLVFSEGFETYSSTVGLRRATVIMPSSLKWGRHRDSQKTKVYKSNWALPMGMRFGTTSDVQAYIDKIILASPWWKANYPHIRRIVVQRGRRKRVASATLYRGEYTITNMPEWSRCQRYILHEIAHLTIADFQQFIPYHGAEFAREFLTLVYQFMGETVAMNLAAQYRKNNVRLASRGYRAVYEPVLAPAILRNGHQIPVTESK